MLNAVDLLFVILLSLIVVTVIIRWPQSTGRSRTSHRLGPVPLYPSSARVHSLDGLRAVSVLLVMASHYGYEHMIPGGLGVTCFFLISGFIITRLLLLEARDNGTIDIRAFLARRFWRLWPATAAAVVATELLFEARYGHTLAALLYMQNYWWIYGDPASTAPNIHWSLAVEAHFYLIWPLVLFAFWRKEMAGILAFLVAAFFAVLAVRFATAHLVERPWWYIFDSISRASHTRVDAIIAGCGLAVLAWKRQDRGLAVPLWPVWFGIWILLATLIYRDDLFRMTARYTIQSTALFMIFASVLFAERGGFVRWALNLPVAVWIGKISFSLYLWHILIWTVVKELTGRETGLDLIAMAVPVTFLVAWASYEWIEKLGIRLGQRLRVTERLA